MTIYVYSSPTIVGALESNTGADVPDYVTNDLLVYDSEGDLRSSPDLPTDAQHVCNVTFVGAVRKDYPPTDYETGRLPVSFGHGIDTPLLTTDMTGYLTVMSYEKDRVKIHDLCGGVAYYTSKSGMSGAGWIRPHKAVRLAWYRTDAPDEIADKKSADIGHVYDYCLYVPISGHGGIDSDYPAVVTDWKKNVAFIDVTEVPMVLKKDFEIDDIDELKEIKKEVFELNDDTFPVLRYIDVNLRGNYKAFEKRPSVFRFLDPDEIQASFVGALLKDGTQTFLQKRAFVYAYEGHHYHIDCEGHIDMWWSGSYDPTLNVECPPRGWIVEGGGLMWRVNRDQKTVYAIKEVDRLEKYTVPGLPRKIEYEIETSLANWMLLNRKGKHELFDAKLAKKARVDWVESSQGLTAEKVAELMAAAPETVVCVQDSLDSGNCSPGTNQFRVEYCLPKETTFLALLSHSRIEEMLSKWEFRKIIIGKLA